MRLSREAIQRMVGGATVGSVGGSGGGSADLSGYATETWVSDNYVSIEFFSKLFKAYDDTTEVLPNDMQSEIDNIRAMFGLWTNDYLSALGLNSGGGGGGGSTLFEPLASINEAGLADHPSSSGQTIVWNGSAWVYGTAGGSGSVTSVGMSVPTGFKVSGDTSQTIINNGTFALTFATGYSLPTTAKQGQWDTAYSNSHTHDNYNVLDGITSTKVGNWDTAYTNSHTHSNKSVLDGITSTKVSNWDTAYGWGNHAIAGYALAADVYSKTAADAKFLTIAAFENLFNAMNSSGQKVSHPYSSAVASIKAMVGLYTDQFLSALGLGSGGSGGVSSLSELTDVVISSPSNGQVLKYDSSTGKWVNGTVQSSGGTVTSVGMTVPTGFSVSGSPVTSSGTLAVSFATGYSLPTTAKQGNWDTAYTNSHTHSNKTVLDGITSTKVSNWDTAYGWGDHAQAGYLPLSAGSSKKLTGSLYLNNYGMGVYVKDPANNYVPVFYQNSQNLWIGAEQTTATHHNGATYISAGHDGTSGNSTIYVCVPNDANNGGTNYGVWHSGNFNPSEYATQSWVTGKGYLTTETDPTVPAWAKASTKPSYSFTEITGTASSNQIPNLSASKITSGTLDAARLPDLSGTYAAVGRVSTLEGYFTSGSAKTAVKLNTARNLWGQSFDGSADVKGDLCLYPSTGDTNSNSAKIEFRTLVTTQSYIYGPYIQAVNVDNYGRKRLSVFQKSEADWTTEQVEVFTILPTGNVGVGTTTPAEKLTVVGNIATATSNGAYIQIGGARLVWDNGSKSLYVVQSDGTTAANFYATGGVSALGQGSGGSGGASALTDLVDVVISNPSNGQVLKYDSATGKWVNGTVQSSGGTVTSVGMTVPTGFSISGSPITTSGTLALTFATGYSLPTTAKQGNWDTAYGWGDHAQAGYATQTWADGRYLPLSAGSSKKLTGSLYLNNYGMGVYVKDPANNYVPVFYQNSQNLWIGAEQTTATHHNGATYISAGHDGTSGNSTIYVCVPNAANNSGTNYGVWHAGNFNPSEYATQAWVNDQVFVKHVTVGTNDLTGYSGSFFFGGSGAIQSGYDYVGFQAGSSNDKWQLTLIDSLIYRQNDNGGTDSTHWTAWRTLLDSSNYTSYLTAYATQSWVTSQGYLTGSSSIAFSQLPAMYWANVRVDSASSLTTEPQFANLTLRNGSATYGSSLYFGDRGCYIVEHSQDFLLYNAENGHKFTTMDYDPLEITAAGYVYVHSDGGLSGNGLRIGDAILEWDSTNNALKLRKSSGANDAVNFYATGGVSALGQGSGGSGSAGALYDCTDVKPNSQGTAVYGASEGKVLMYGSDGKWYAGSVSSGSGTVTSVGLSVPTGFKVSGDTSQTIINNGTFALTFATGYSLPTTAKQTSWDTAASGVSTLDGYFSSGSAKTAVKLNTERSLWGQSFDGSADVKGDLCLYPSSGNVNSNSAKLEFRTLAGATYASYIYAPYIQGINVTTYGRQRLGFFQKNNADWTTAQVEVMSILPDGKVGINTTQPTEWLEVNGDAKIANLRLQSGTANYGSYLRFGDRQLCFLCEDSDDHLQVYGNDGIEFSTQDYDQMEITDDGYVHVRSGDGSGMGLRVGNVVLKWDSANNALKIEKYGGGSVNVVVSGGVAALG